MPAPHTAGRAACTSSEFSVYRSFIYSHTETPRVPYTQCTLLAGGPAPHSHLVCGGCQTLLMYPQGAANVRCSRCQYITPAPPTAGAETAQLLCNGCRVLLSYPRGAQSVQCSMCHTVTQVSARHHLARFLVCSMKYFPRLQHAMCKVSFSLHVSGAERCIAGSSLWACCLWRLQYHAHVSSRRAVCQMLSEFYH